MKLNLGKHKDMEGIWVKYDKDISFKIRYASPALFRKARKEATEIIIKKWRGQEVKNVNIDEDKENDLIWDSIIEDWKGIDGDNNKPAPCTSENKKLLRDISIDHTNFIWDFSNDINNFVGRKEEEIKNSLTSSDSK